MSGSKKTIENVMGKGENAGKQHFFFLFQKCFQPLPKQLLIFHSNFILSTANAFNFGIWKRAKKMEGKGENAGYQHFLLFSQCF